MTDAEEVNYWIFPINADKERSSSADSEDKEHTNEYWRKHWFDSLVVKRNIWKPYKTMHHGPKSDNSVKAGDKAIFYFTESMEFVGSAELISGAEEVDGGEYKDTFRIKLKDVVEFEERKKLKDFKSLRELFIRTTKSISKREYKIILSEEPDIPLLPNASDIKEETESGVQFALEKYLEEFIWDNWEKINFGEKLDKFQGDEGRQYLCKGSNEGVDIGRIDILATDKEGNFVILELKKGRERDQVVGQVLRYMAWVRKNLATKGKKVKGIVIVGEKDDKLEFAVSEVQDKVSVKLYEVNFKLIDYDINQSK